VTTWLGQYCLYVDDLERSVAFYEALGLRCTSRTEIEGVVEAIVENPSGGSKLQLACRTDGESPAGGTAFWKLYVNTLDVAATFAAAVEAGASVDREPERTERWPVTIAFVLDPDGHLVELVERHPWPDDAPAEPWLGQVCVNVTDIEATIRFWERLGLTCTSRTEIDHAHEAILERPGQGGKLQLAQQLDQSGPIEMGTVWKLYLNTDDCEATHQVAVDAGYASVSAPVRLERWPTTIAFVADPDGYQVELVQLDRRPST